MNAPKSFLIIQTAFTGDVVLATAIVEKIHQHFPDAAIDFLLRKGNESLLHEHPFIRKVLIWHKKQRKLKDLFRIIRTVRKARYDYVINAHRFASSGITTIFSRAKVTIGFDKNPLSFLFTKKIPHIIDEGIHETARNQRLIESLTGPTPARPALYPTVADFETVKKFQQNAGAYLCFAPTSVWFTKQFPPEKWIALLAHPDFVPKHIFLLGAPGDRDTCEVIRTESRHPNVINLAGSLSFLESAALMKGAKMNFVNDSAPMHFASATNAPVTAIYCSTVPSFGFGPLSDVSNIVQTKEELDCRPCGLHGYKACPKGHFKCALTIQTTDLTIA